MDPVKIAVDAGKCRKDGLCARVCPMRIFVWKKGETPGPRHEQHCVLCGQCIAVCPSGAISNSLLDAARFQRIADRAPLDPDAFVALLSQRRSVRVYKDQPVPRELLERLARVVGFAPGSPHDRVGWVRSMIFVTGKDNMRRVAEFTVQYVRAVNKLLGSAMLGTFSRWSEMLQGARRIVPDCRMRLAEWEEGRDALIYDAPAAVFFHAPRNAVEPQADCDAALLTFALAAHAHGLGTCWNGLLNKAASGYKARKLKGLRKLIGMPDANDCYAAATIGYPAIKLHSLPHREVDARFVGW